MHEIELCSGRPSNKDFLFHPPSQHNSRTKDVCHDGDCESDAEHARQSKTSPCPSRKRSTDHISSSAMISNKSNSPIHPHQDLVKCIEKLQVGSALDDASAKNGHYELINIGKVPSEPSLKLNSTLPTKTTANKVTTQWHPKCDKPNDFKPSTQATSMTNININNNNDKSIGNQQLGSSHFCLLRSRTQAKSLSTRISSLKRESKTTRTLSIGKSPNLVCIRVS